MKIIFFGEDSFSNIVLQSLLESKFKVSLVVCPLYNNIIHKRLENNCAKNSISFLRVSNFEDYNFIKLLKNLDPDLIVITHFKKLLKKEIISIPKFGCINLHPSLLPKYRGMAPQHWPIINGDSETGITVHYVDEFADTGDIILQKKVAITPNMYVSDLQLEFSKIYNTIIIESINLIKQSNFCPIKQSTKTGSYYGKLKEEHCKISIDGCCIQAINLIRAVSKPYRGAFIDNLIIWKAHIANNSENSKLLGYSNIGLHFSREIGYFINLKDGKIIIDKFEIINHNETRNN